MENICYLLVVGSRTIVDYRLVGPFLDGLISTLSFNNYVVVSGGARGVDSLAEFWADQHHFEKKVFLANWDLYGKRAGFVRNEEMHKFIAQFENRKCIAFWDGKSAGTKQNFQLCEIYHTELIRPIC